MYAMLNREKDSWMASRLELRHSHPCSAKKSVYYHVYRELTIHAKCVITDNDEASIRHDKTYLALANEVGGSSNLNFSKKDVRNYIASKLCCADENADFKELLNYFMRMKEINLNLFHAINVDDANKFRSTLWVNARCRALYEYYGDVVLFDTTYKRNRYVCLRMNYRLHTLSVSTTMGSLHLLVVLCWGTRRSLVLSECSRNELDVWKLYHVGSSPTSARPYLILPNTRHQWCIWHILKKITTKLESYAWYREINAKMSDVVQNSCSMDSFDIDWAEFIKEFDLGYNRWLSAEFERRRKQQNCKEMNVRVETKA
ncbi:hypothetical protein Ahy_A10g048586 [Arachis hypogaea]|uniref:Uncharacterized protein n=1 Tax=Arachis hypogaea TaxID=3818 RepID=A0A445B5G0_ARAHY|nr:hypothetical protein Ahy_A10g048586 [Arachis hypogaea]